jgi:hypothetical protein
VVALEKKYIIIIVNVNAPLSVVNAELEMVWNEILIVQFEVLGSAFLWRDLQKPQKYLCHYSTLQGQRPPEYRAI